MIGTKRIIHDSTRIRAFTHPLQSPILDTLLYKPILFAIKSLTMNQHIERKDTKTLSKM